MLLAVVGFLMLFVMMFLLFKGKTIPLVVFITVPVIAAFIAGFSVPEVVEFIKKGITKTSPMAVLFIFSVTFFGLMSDAGMFDAVVDKLVAKAGTNVVSIAVVTALVAIFSHLDGATVTTVLVTVPAFLPLYRKLNIRPQLLLLIVGAGMGVMNLLPWGGPVARASTVLGMDPNKLWHVMIPVQILGIVTTVTVAVLAAMREVKYHGAGVITHSEEVAVDEVEKKDDKEDLKRPKLLFFNFALTAGVLALLLIDIFPTYFVFMIGCCVALIVNYPDPKEQKRRVKAHAPAALDVSAVMLSAGIMVGVLGKSGMLEAMTKPLLVIIPSALASHLHILLGTVALPLGTMLGTDSYFYGLMPLAIEVGKNYQITGLTMAVAMMIGKNLALFISPLVPATFLGIGLADIELKDHLKYSFGWLWATGMVMLVFAVMIGMIGL
ncbi:citrate:proton symporter [uncultured Ilyobacter sp.]|uniref:CitMHS family transporter n=1 Tax=uncultured Ilyobacter sp. TaxID=544433 RepID=UPI0029C0B908|nr:citrate:proton symporter [uncultured Ilyobacter sp.]